jgi:hypothetical protein
LVDYYTSRLLCFLVILTLAHNDEQYSITPPHPTLSHIDKLYIVNFITNQIPIKLDIDKANNVAWCYFFKHCENFDELKHNTGTSSGETLQCRLVMASPKFAKEAWDILLKPFFLTINALVRAIALKGKLRVIQLGD